MDKGKADGIREGKKILERVFVEYPLKFIEKSFGVGTKVKIILIIGVIISLIIASSFFVSFGANLKALTAEIPKNTPIPQITPNPSSEQPKTPLQNVKGLNSEDKPCVGKIFEVIQELDDVLGKEQPFIVDVNDRSTISASGSANSQVTKRYPFTCKPPWEVRLSFAPLKEQSIGVFIEYEDVFKILLGDGDRQTWKIEKNDLGRKTSWSIAFKEKLVNGKISLNKEVTIIISAKPKGNSLDLNIKFRYTPEGKNDYIWEERLVNIEAKATDLIGVPARAIRVGLNDSRYKGVGSEIQFGSFSIKELR